MKMRGIIWALIVIILLGFALLLLSRLGLISFEREPYDKRYMQSLTEGNYLAAASLAMREAYQAENAGQLHGDAAWAFELAGDHENAKLYAKTALELDPNVLRAQYVSFLQEADADASATALAFFSQQRTEQQQDTMMLLAEALLHYQLGNFNDVIPLTADFLAGHPDFWLAQFLHADSLYFKDDFENAAQEYQYILNLHPKDLDSQLGLGYCQLRTNQLQEAARTADAIIAIESTWYEAASFKAEVAIAQKDYPSATEWLEKALVLGADPVSCYQQLAKTYREMKNWAASAQNWREWGEISGLYERMEIEIAYNDYVMGKADAYEEKLASLQRRYPSSSDVAYAVGEFYLMETRYREAAEAMQRVLNLDPKDSFARAQYWYALFEGGRFQQCLDAVQNWSIENPEDARAQSYIADSELRLLNFLHAEAAYLTAWRIEPWETVHLKKLASLYIMSSQYTQATQVMQLLRKTSTPDEETEELVSEIERFGRGSLAQRVQNRLEDSYLFPEKLPEILQLTHDMPASEQNNAILLDAWVMSTLNQDDPYCFAASGEFYDWLMTSEQTPSVTIKPLPKALGEGYLVDVDAFTMETGNMFIEAMEAIDNTSSSRLVFDLRQNGGGDMQSCVEILDYLTGKGELVTLTNRDGVKDWVAESDADMTPFFQIVLWADQNTASSAELLILGLQQRLDNVLVVGENSFGKGVAQEIVIDAVAQFALLATSHFWSVDGINIHQKGIQPDVKAVGDTNVYIRATAAHLKPQ